MNYKLLFAVIIIVLVIGITTFTAVVNAKGLNLLCFKKYEIIVTLKNEAEIEKSKNAILEIPQIKIVNIKYRDEEWSRMVNKMDLPKMENPFKNEFTIRVNKNADMDEIFNKIKVMNFVENIKYALDENIK